jgi:hypothetical protein
MVMVIGLFLSAMSDPVNEEEKKLLEGVYIALGDGDKNTTTSKVSLSDNGKQLKLGNTESDPMCNLEEKSLPDSTLKEKLQNVLYTLRCNHGFFLAVYEDETLQYYTDTENKITFFKAFFPSKVNINKTVGMIALLEKQPDFKSKFIDQKDISIRYSYIKDYRNKHMKEETLSLPKKENTISGPEKNPSLKTTGARTYLSVFIVIVCILGIGIYLGVNTKDEQEAEKPSYNDIAPPELLDKVGLPDHMYLHDDPAQPQYL